MYLHCKHTQVWEKKIILERGTRGLNSNKLTQLFPYYNFPPQKYNRIRIVSLSISTPYLRKCWFFFQLLLAFIIFQTLYTAHFSFSSPTFSVEHSWNIVHFSYFVTLWLYILRVSSWIIVCRTFHFSCGSKKCWYFCPKSITSKLYKRNNNIIVDLQTAFTLLTKATKKDPRMYLKLKEND